MARGKKLAPFPGKDTANAELWTGKKGVDNARGKLSVDDAQRVLAFAMMPFDGSGNVLRALRAERYSGPRFEDEPKTHLEHFQHIYRKAPEDCLRVMDTVTKYMRGRSKIAQAVAADTSSPARVVAERLAARLPVHIADTINPGAITTARKRLRKSMQSLRDAEANE